MRRKFMQKLIKPLLTKKGYLIFSVIVVILFSAWVIPDAMKAEVVIATDEETKVVKTSKETVGDLLEEIGISVSDHDHISHPTNTELEDGMEISYKKAKKINLQIDEEKEQYFTTKDTVGQFLDEQNISLNEHDELSHKRIEKIEEGLTVKIDRAFQVVIDDGGDEKKVWTTGGTVGQILADEAIHYDELDKIKPSLNEKVTEETSDIQIVHVELETEKIEETIDFEVEERKDDSLEK